MSRLARLARAGQTSRETGWVNARSSEQIEQLELLNGDLNEEEAEQQGGRWLGHLPPLLSYLPPVVKTRLTGVGTSVTLPVGVSSPVS